jgi:serine protease
MKSFQKIVLAGVCAAAFLAAESVSAGDARVWVKFKPGSAEKTKGALLSVGAQIHYRFDDLEAFAVSVPEAALTGLQKNPNIEFIEEDVKRYPSAQTVPYGIDKVQAPLVWNDISHPSTGADIKLCVIDSGVGSNHEDLVPSNISGSGDNSLPWNVDGCGHGTHVTGTIAAQNNALGVVGVAPSVGIHMVRVFGNDCGWSYSSTLVNAAQKCQTAGAKVINMSLGGDLKSRVEQSAFGSLYSAGILSVAAAGNDGSTKLSYPASYPSVISVAAVDQNNTVADFSQKNSTVELAAPGVGVLSTVPWSSVNTVTVDGTTYSGGSIENAAAGTATGPVVDGGLCDSIGSWTGQVVLCERGIISFYDKVTNVENGGGIAAVIYNNVSGGFAGTLGDGNSSTIPAIALSQQDGTALLEYLQASTTATEATVVSSFTPGESGYEAWDGTSMATPHVSGVAALLWSVNPSLTNVDIRNALTSTALDLGSAGKDNSYGYGLVQAKAALDALEGAGSGGGSDGGSGGSCNVDSPNISGVNFDATVKGPKFKITWTTDVPATSVVNLTGYGTYTDSSLVTSHSMTFTGSYGVTYEYSVSSSNCAGTATSGTTFGTNN